jgi:hypothetical protein
MKWRYFVVFIFISLFTIAWMNSPFVGGDNSLDWSTIELFFRAESSSMGSGDCYDSSDDTWAASGSPAYSADARYSGAYGLDTYGPGNDGYLQLNPTAGNYDSTSFAVGWWWNVNAVGASTVSILYWMQDNSNRLIVGLQTDGDVAVNYNQGGSGQCSTIYTGTAFDSAGWHFIQVSVDMDVGAGSDYIKVYIDGDMDQSTENCTGTPFTLHDQVFWGDISEDATYDAYHDVFISSTDPTINFYTEGYASATLCP